MEQSAYPRSAEQWFQLIREKWDEILTYIRTEFDDIPVVSYNIWISGLKPGSLKKTREGGYILSILVPDENNVAAGQNQPALPGKVYRDVLNRKYSAHISVAVCEVTGITQEIPGTAFTLEFTERAPKTAEKENVLINKKPSTVDPDTLASANLNPRYTFDTFVVGKNNNMAHAYALGVAENPGILYNPLFLYGGVGLGKTHLMQSIAHFVLQSNPKAHVLYVTSESFTNELIDAIRAYKNENIAEFRNKYRNIDILLIDDDVVNQTIPLILCDEEDVEGNHGATIGKLDEELLFYMQSRGLPVDTIYEMMASAHVEALLGQVPDEKTRCRVRKTQTF